MKTDKQVEEIAKRYAPTDRDAMNLAEDIYAYGREQKKLGARSLAKLVKKCRRKQKDYFSHNKSREGFETGQRLLKESKSIETQVDNAVEIILKNIPEVKSQHNERGESNA